MYRLICCYFQKMIKFEHPRLTRNKLSAKEIWSLTIIPEDVNLKKIAIAEFGSSEALNLLVKLFPSGSALYFINKPEDYNKILEEMRKMK